MSKFNECLHGPLEFIGDTGSLTEGELRALVQNLCQRVIRLEDKLIFADLPQVKADIHLLLEREGIAK